jgi:hypothetical protein
MHTWSSDWKRVIIIIIIICCCLTIDCHDCRDFVKRQASSDGEESCKEAAYLSLPSLHLSVASVFVTSRHY